MVKKRFGFTGLLSEGEIEKLEDSALEILSKYGMSVHHEKAMEKLAGFKGVKIKNGRACLDRNLVKDYIEFYKKDKDSIDLWSGIENLEAESMMRLDGRTHTYPFKPVLYPSGHCSHILDPGSQKIRPLLTQDVIDCTKLLDNIASDNYVKVSAPGNPKDVPTLLQPVLRYKISCEYSRHGGFWAPCNEIRPAEYIFEMSKVMGKYFIPSMCVISPLKMGGSDFNTIMHFIGKKLPLQVGTWSMLGATVPISVPKACAQILAEGFGAYTILKLLSSDSVVGFKIRMFGFDMKEASINYGTPESILLDIICADLNRHYGNAAVFQINTMAKEVGVQSGAEKLSSSLFGILSGVSALADIGSLCLDELFSPEQAIYDLEILDNAMRLAEGLDFEDFNTSSFITELSETKTFLQSEETIINFRKAYWLSKIFSRSMLQQSLTRKENQRDTVREIVKQKIKSHDFVLDDDKRKEISKIYESAKKELG